MLKQNIAIVPINKAAAMDHFLRKVANCLIVS